MAIDHKNIPDAELHNLKGFAGAGNNTLPRKDALGNYIWAQVDANTLATNAVTTAKIVNGDVTNAKLANGSVTNAKLGNDSVSTSKIAASAVTSSELTSSERMTTNNVLGQVAGAALNAVGSYRNAFYIGTAQLNPGDTVAGSNIAYETSSTVSDSFRTIDSGNTAGLSGTWRYVGQSSIIGDASAPAGLFLRIS